MIHTLPKLPFAYDALEPHLDARTVEIHYGKHHQAYVDNLNKALSAYPELQAWTLEQLILRSSEVPEKIRTAVRNNAGQHLNHSLYWQYLSPRGGNPSSALLAGITRAFGSLASFQAQFTQTALAHFGSGWAWLVVHHGALEVLSTPNQENPLVLGAQPILVCDVWEHAYYLKYQNRRADYLAAWWKVVDWNRVAEAFSAVGDAPGASRRKRDE
ncbi:MAG: superoxide dismutase [Patescibacteria group bacterium]|nr:superoxide dismutase [Patescibacteria group bacterium]